MPAKLTLVLSDDHKVCARCKIDQPKACFGKDASQRDSLTASCRSCRNAYARKRNVVTSGVERYEKHLRMKYGVSRQEYDRILVSQNGVCAICRRPGREERYHGLYVDHCHSTGKVRGLLCRACNLTLGMVEDDPARLRCLADYLEKNR